MKLPMSRQIHITTLAERPEYVEELVQLLHQEWRDFAPWSDCAKIRERLLGLPHPARATCCLLALNQEDVLLGTASIKWQELSHLQYDYWLGEVFIRADLRGLGIGSRFIAGALQHARHAKIAALYLYTPDQQALYQRFGWREIKREIANGELVSVMELHLPR